MKKLFLLFTLVGLFATSCEMNEVPPVKQVHFELSHNNISINAGGGTASVTVFSNDYWEIEGTSDWCSPSVRSGGANEDGTTVNFVAKESYAPREATFYFLCGEMRLELKVSQEQKDSIVLEGDTLLVPAKGGSVALDYQANVDCEVIIPDDAKEWISIDPQTRGLEKYSVTLVIAPNDSFDERTTAIKVEGESVSRDIEVKQMGIERVLSLSPSKLDLPLEATNITIDVDANIDYEVVIADDCDWVTMPEAENTIENKVILAIAENPTIYSRDTEILFKGDGKDVILPVVQRGDEGVLMLNNKYIADGQDTVLSIEFNSNFDYTVSIPSACDWLSLPETRAVVQTHTIEFALTKNPSLDDRSVEVIFSDAKGDISKSVKITQLGSPLYCVVPNANEILYITTDGEVLDINDIYLGSIWGSTVIDHTYEDGIGRITCSSAITQIVGFFGCTTLEQIAIPDSVTTLGYQAFENCTSLTGITIPDSVTKIESTAFRGCTSLTSITIPDSVTEIGYSAFEDCDSLESVTIGNGVTSIGGYAFRGCTGELIVNCNIPSVSDYTYSFFFRSKFTKVTIGDSVTKIGNYAFCNCTSLTSITIPNSVNTIGDSAFRNCTSLTSITIPDSVTEIGYYAFRGCTSLTSITIPDSVTEIGGYTFENCTSLTSITIPDSVTEIGYSAFEDCTSLTNVTIPDSVTSIGESAFSGCTSLESVTIGDGVTEIGDYAFRDCTSLTSITIPDSVTTIDCNAFWYCDSLERFNGKYASEDNRCLIFDGVLVAFAYAGLTEYAIPDSVTSIGERAFYNCYSLTSITIPNSVTSIGDSAFECCNSLTSMTIPESVTSIGDTAFGRCTGELIVNCNIRSPSPFNTPPYSGVFAYADFTKVTIGDSVTSIGEEAFYHCTSLESITIGKGVTWIGEDAFLECTGELIINCNVPSKNSDEWSEDTFFGAKFSKVTIGDNATTIGDDAFRGCTSLTSVTIPDSVTSIGDDAFRGCTSLTSVYITDIAAWCNISFGNADSNPLRYEGNLYLNNELVTDLIIPDGVTSIGSSAFYNCNSLTSVTIGNGVTSIGNSAFYSCSSLTSITIPDGVTSIGGSTFEYCNSLKSVTIGESVTDIGDYAFRGCTSLTSVNIPESVTEIGEYAFLDCTSLTSVYITDIAAWCNISFGNADSNPLRYAGNLYLNNELVTDLIIPDGVTKIGKYAFRGCTSLTSITIPDSVTSIGGYAFSGCTSLESVTIGDSVTSIGNYAFYNCTSLESVTIGKSVTTIKSHAFDGCTSLTRVYCKPTTPPSLGTNAFVFNGRWYATIYVPTAWRYEGVAGWDVFNIVGGYDF